MELVPLAFEDGIRLKIALKIHIVNESVTNPSTDMTDLNHHGNYVCLGNTVDVNKITKTELIKQRAQ